MILWGFTTVFQNTGLIIPNSSHTESFLPALGEGAFLSPETPDEFLYQRVPSRPAGLSLREGNQIATPVSVNKHGTGTLVELRYKVLI